MKKRGSSEEKRSKKLHGCLRNSISRRINARLVTVNAALANIWRIS